MAQPYTAEYFRKCVGLATYASPEHISDNELAEGTYNVVPVRDGVGVLAKRLGIEKLSGSPGAVTRVTSIYTGVNSSNLYYTDQGTDLVIRDINGTALNTSAALSAGTPSWTSHYVGATKYDLVLGSNNLALKTSDGSTFSAIAGIPTGAKWIESYNKYLFCAGQSATSLRWTDVSSITWTATNEYILDPISNDSITGIRRDGTNLIVWFNRMFVVLQGYGPTFQVVDVNRRIGTEFNSSVVDTPYGMFFWSTNGGMCRIGRGNYQDIDMIMQRKLPSLAHADTPSPVFITCCWVPWDNCVRYYVINVSGAIRYDYYPTEDAIYKHTGAGCGMTSSMIYESAKDLYLGGTSAAGTNYLYREVTPLDDTRGGTSYTDDGTTIQARIFTKTHNRGSNIAEKTCISAMPQVLLSGWNVNTTGTLTYGVAVDRQTAGGGAPYLDSWDITPADGSMYEPVVSVNKRHRVIQHVLVDEIKGARTYYYLLSEAGTVDKVLP